VHDYGPSVMLNAIAEAIMLLKSRHTRADGTAARCVLVAHDWGGVIGSRLAAETTGVIDELIMVNTAYVC